MSVNSMAPRRFSKNTHICPFKVKNMSSQKLETSFVCLFVFKENTLSAFWKQMFGSVSILMLFCCQKDVKVSFIKTLISTCQQFSNCGPRTPDSPQYPFSGSETGGKGAGHNLWKNGIALEHDINWLEPNGSKMADKSTSTRPWASVYTHCNTSAS